MEELLKEYNRVECAISDASDLLRDLNKELDALKTEAVLKQFGVAVGDVVKVGDMLATLKEFFLCSWSPQDKSKPWAKGCFPKLDGTPGKKVVYLYDNWEV